MNGILMVVYYLVVFSALFILLLDFILSWCKDAEWREAFESLKDMIEDVCMYSFFVLLVGGLVKIVLLFL